MIIKPRGQTAVRTLIISVAASAVAAVTTFAVTGAGPTLNLDPNDKIIVLRGGSVKVTNLELRSNQPDGGQVFMNVYARVETIDGGQFDLGGASCPSGDSGWAHYRVMNEYSQRRCATGDSGVSTTRTRVHGLDLILSKDGGVETRAYGHYYPAPDGGPVSFPGHPCSVAPYKSKSIMEGDGLKCFLKEKGFAR